VGILFLSLVFAQLLFWQFQLIVCKVFAPARLARNIHQLTVGYAQRLLSIAHCYLDLRLVFESKHSTRNLTEYVNENREQLGSQFVILSNHQSLIDIIAMLVGFPRILARFVAKKELGAWFPAVSMVLREGEHALIDRKKNLNKTAADLKNFATRCRKRGYSPIIFPEGTRSVNGKLGTFNAGAARILLSSLPLPVLVLAVDGGSEVSHLLRFSRGGRTIYRVKPVAIFPPPQGKTDIMRLLTDSREKIQNQIDKWHSLDSVQKHD
jgi:1-acyl-sn-glycerol-3-phosphate acyltransferase